MSEKPYKIDISEKRLERFEKISSLRQTDLTVVLENVHDPHNIGAILRSCDSIGIDEVYIIDTDPRLQGRSLQNKGSSTGINKWIKINYFTNIDECIHEVKSRFSYLVGTVIGNDSKSLYHLDYSKSTAFVFGNEKDGITDDLAKHLDQNMLIPQVGFAQSLNVSVACAVTLYEAMRQRLKTNNYEKKSQPEVLQRFINADQTKRLNKINN